MSEKSSIITIDDHPLLRKGLKQLVEFEDDIEIIAEASNGPDGIKLAIELEPDLTIRSKYAKYGWHRNIKEFTR